MMVEMSDYGRNMVTISFYLLLLLLLVAVLSVAVRAEGIPAGDCLNVTTSGNLTEEYCALFPPLFEEQFTLDPGQSRVAQNDYCLVSVSARGCSQADDLCVKRQTLDPGETYEVLDGACDLKIKCDPCDAPKNDGLNMTYLADVNIKKTKDVLRVLIDGEEVVWSLVGTDLNIDYSMPVACPVSVNEDTIDSYTDESLVKFASLLNFYPRLMNKTLEVNDVWAARLEKKDDVIKTKDSDITRLQTEATSARTLMEEHRSELNNTLTRLSIAQDDLLSSQKKASTLSGLLFGVSLLFFVLLGCFIVLGVAFVKRGGGDS